MGLTVKNLAEGVINATSGASPQVLYPGSAALKGALIKSIVLSNISASVDVTIQLKIRPASTPANDKYIAPVNLLIIGGRMFVLDADITLSLDAPDQIIS